MYIHVYIHTYIRTHIYTCMHTCIRTVFLIVILTKTVHSLHLHSAFDQGSFKPSFILIDHMIAEASQCACRRQSIWACAIEHYDLIANQVVSEGHHVTKPGRSYFLKIIKMLWAPLAVGTGRKLS